MPSTPVSPISLPSHTHTHAHTHREISPEETLPGGESRFPWRVCVPGCPPHICFPYIPSITHTHTHASTEISPEETLPGGEVGSLEECVFQDALHTAQGLDHVCAVVVQVPQLAVVTLVGPPEWVLLQHLEGEMGYVNPYPPGYSYVSSVNRDPDTRTRVGGPSTGIRVHE